MEYKRTHTNLQMKSEITSSSLSFMDIQYHNDDPVYPAHDEGLQFLPSSLYMCAATTSLTMYVYILSRNCLFVTVVGDEREVPLRP